jgi:hypothetical protein
VSARLHRRVIVFAGALLLGVLADALLRVDARPGVNAALFALAAAAILWVLARRTATPVSAESRWLVVAAAGFAGLLVLRDAEALAVFCLLSCIVLLGLAAGRGAMAWARRTRFTGLAAAALRVAVLIALGPIGWAFGAARQAEDPAADRRHGWGHARMVARGTAMALPALLVLTALLSSADPVFARILHLAMFDAIQPLLEHLAFAGVVAWLASGYLRALLLDDAVAMEGVQLPRPSLAPAEVAFALGLLDLLFLAFIAVQLRYLFGGAALVDVTPGLGYAEYARSGFFELVAATALVVPLLLLADWVARDDGSRGRTAMRMASVLLVVLLAGVLASAAFRMRLYQAAYGLTEQRVYGSMFMAWLAGVLAWLAATVLRGRRDGFVSGAIAGGLACVVALHVLNPHALIARVNLQRAASGASNAVFDGDYLRNLGADAVPTLVASLPALPPGERCRLADALERRWSGPRDGGWRTWNLGDARARRLVARLPEATPCVGATGPSPAVP